MSEDREYVGRCRCGFEYEDRKYVCWKCGTRPCERCKRDTGSVFLSMCLACDLCDTRDTNFPPVPVPQPKGKKCPPSSTNAAKSAKEPAKRSKR